MALFRPGRARRGEDPHQSTKILIFALGAAAGLAGIATGRDWLVTTGILILAIGVALRVVGARNEERD